MMTYLVTLINKIFLTLLTKIRLEIEIHDILFDHEPIDTTPSVQGEPELRLDFSDILLKDNNKIKHKAAKNIREKYLRMGRNRDKVRKSAQRAIRQLKKSKYLKTDDTETVDYNNDIDITDVNDDLSSDAATIIYEEPIIKRRNPKRKSDLLQRFDTERFVKNVGDSYDVQCIKQVPMHPRDRLARATKNARSDGVELIKQVPARPKDRLRRKAKILKHTRDWMKEKKLKVARENVSALMQGRFFFIQKFF